MLSEARKYKLFLTMAEQSTSQQDELQTVNIILANVGTVICFRTGNPADEKLVLPLFKPHINEGEIANLPSYNFYMRIAAVKSQEPFSGETVLLEDSGSESMAEKVITASRNNYASKRAAKVVSKKIKASQKQDDQKDPEDNAELLPAAD
jgi:DNA helicase HerA-like ATPase